MTREREADGGDADEDETVTVTLVDPDGEGEGDGDDPVRITAREGAVLRDVLLAAGNSPYTRYTERLNCGGRGVCATCGVRILDGEDHDPDHWHDRLADRFGYPRLSCQVRLSGDLTVAVPDKRVWGGRDTG